MASRANPKRISKPKNKLACSIKLPSLESKGVKTPLPECLMGGGFRRADVMKYVAVPRYELLPRVLIPRPKGEARPPKFHYGWSLDGKREFLMAYAKEHGLLWGPTVDDPPDEDWYEAPENPQPIEIDEISSMSHALTAIVQEISSIPPRTVRIMTAMNCERGVLVVAIYNNFELEKVPSEAFIERLRVALGETAKPSWFLDGTDVSWRAWH